MVHERRRETWRDVFGFLTGFGVKQAITLCFSGTSSPGRETSVSPSWDLELELLGPCLS